MTVNRGDLSTIGCKIFASLASQMIPLRPVLICVKLFLRSFSFCFVCLDSEKDNVFIRVDDNLTSYLFFFLICFIRIFQFFFTRILFFIIYFFFFYFLLHPIFFHQPDALLAYWSKVTEVIML